MLRLILACVVAMLLVTAPAFADTRQQILRECQDGALTGSYTAKQIRDARDNIPTDVDQYTDCRSVLARALLGLAGGSNGSGGSPSPGSGGSGGAGGGTGGSGGGTTGTGGGGTTGATPAPAGPTTPADNQALADATKGAGPVDVGGTPVTAGAAGLNGGAARTTPPELLIVALALLALAALAGMAPLLRRGVGRARLGNLGRRVLARGR